MGSGSKENDVVNLGAAPGQDFDEKHHPQVSHYRLFFCPLEQIS